MEPELRTPARLWIRHCVEADVHLLEWSGAFRPHRRIIEATFDASRRGEQIMLVGALNDWPIAQIWIDVARHRNEHVGHLWAFRVHPLFQGRGVGGALLRSAERELTQRGYYSALIEVEPDRHVTRDIYERAGYCPQRVSAVDWSYLDPDHGPVTVRQDLLSLVKTL